jgi:hypothetical protein
MLPGEIGEEGPTVRLHFTSTGIEPLLDPACLCHELNIANPTKRFRAIRQAVHILILFHGLHIAKVRYVDGVWCLMLASVSITSAKGEPSGI